MSTTFVLFFVFFFCFKFNMILKIIIKPKFNSNLSKI
jgi:hypothetical protein